LARCDESEDLVSFVELCLEESEDDEYAGLGMVAVCEEAKSNIDGWLSKARRVCGKTR
jgi:hypothetical protein